MSVADPPPVHPALLRAAETHSEDMIRRDYFYHDAKGKNETACERARRFGYRYCGENIGYNSTPQRMFDAWMGSPGHRSNILNGKFREVGIGARSGRHNGYNTTTYTADFGKRLY